MILKTLENKTVRMLNLVLFSGQEKKDFLLLLEKVGREEGINFNNNIVMSLLKNYQYKISSYRTIYFFEYSKCVSIVKRNDTIIDYYLDSDGSLIRSVNESVLYRQQKLQED